jgi:hypothetical protein
MPLRTKMHENKFTDMPTSQSSGEKPETGIKVIIIGAGTTAMSPMNNSTLTSTF